MEITHEIGKGIKYYNRSQCELDRKRRKYLEKAAECGNQDALWELLNGNKLYSSELDDSDKMMWICAFVSDAEKFGDVNGMIKLLFSITERFKGEYIPQQIFLKWVTYLENLDLDIIHQEELVRLINANTKLPQVETLNHTLILAKKGNYLAEIVTSLSYLLVNKFQFRYNEETGFIDYDNKAKSNNLHISEYDGRSWEYYTLVDVNRISRVNLNKIMEDMCVANNPDILDVLQSSVNNYLNDMIRIAQNQTIIHDGLNDERLSEYLQIMYAILWGYAYCLYNINHITEAGYLFANALNLEERIINDVKECHGEKYLKLYCRPIILDNNVVAEALYKCGLYFEQGNSVDINIESAVYYYKEAAKLDNADAQAALGICYALGNGVPRNEDNARELLTNAAKQDNVRALQFLDEHPELKAGVRNISYHAEGDIIQGNSGIIAKDDAVVNRANIGGDANSSAQEYKYCMYCGEKLPAEARFCMKCGKQV